MQDDMVKAGIHVFSVPKAILEAFGWTAQKMSYRMTSFLS